MKNKKAAPQPNNGAAPEEPFRHHDLYAQFDNDLAIENLTNDIPPEDL